MRYSLSEEKDTFSPSPRHKITNGLLSTEQKLNYLKNRRPNIDIMSNSIRNVVKKRTSNKEINLH